VPRSADDLSLGLVVPITTKGAPRGESKACQWHWLLRWCAVRSEPNASGLGAVRLAGDHCRLLEYYGATQMHSKWWSDRRQSRFRLPVNAGFEQIRLGVAGDSPPAS
jgi:hypothetical protein